MKRILMVGSAIVDILVKSPELRVLKNDRIPGGVALCEVYGGKIEAKEMAVETGGAGTNVAVGLARLGESPLLFSKLGKDWIAERVLNNLRAEGVEISGIKVLGKEKSGLSVVLVAQGGGRSILTYRGASQDIEPGDIDWEMIKKADWMQVAALGGNIDLLEDLVFFAVKNGVRVGLNPGKAELAKRERMRKVLSSVSLLSLNRTEAADLVGGKGQELKDLAKSILEMGVRVVAVTDGRKGAGIGDKENWFKAESIKIESVDDTGAGDAFVTGVVKALNDGHDLETALRMGICNGASVVRYLGAKQGLLRPKEMKTWLRRKLKIVVERM